MLVSANALGSTLALLASFLGIGVIANVLVVYIVGLVKAEQRQDQERRDAGGY